MCIRDRNEAETGFEKIPTFAGPYYLGALIKRVHDQTISNNAAKKVLDSLWITEIAPPITPELGAESVVDDLIKEMGLKQMNDSGALEAIVDQVLAANPKNVDEFKAGNAKALNALVGQIMKASQGKANPAQVNALLKAKLG